MVEGTKENIREFHGYLKKHFPSAIEFGGEREKRKVSVSGLKFDNRISLANSEQYNQSLILEQLDKGIGYQTLGYQAMKEGFTEMREGFAGMQEGFTGMKQGFAGMRKDSKGLSEKIESGFASVSTKPDELPEKIAKAIKTELR